MKSGKNSSGTERETDATRRREREEKNDSQQYSVREIFGAASSID